MNHPTSWPTVRKQVTFYYEKILRKRTPDKAEADIVVRVVPPVAVAATHVPRLIVP